MQQHRIRSSVMGCRAAQDTGGPLPEAIRSNPRFSPAVSGPTKPNSKCHPVPFHSTPSPKPKAAEADRRSPRDRRSLRRTRRSSGASSSFPPTLPTPRRDKSTSHHRIGGHPWRARSPTTTRGHDPLPPMEDPGPSSAAPDPPPPPKEDDRWVVVPASEVEGADAPKVFNWEDLQQELARLWSLSNAFAAARVRKAQLTSRLESVLEARRAFLQQDNELAGMRQRLQEHADYTGDLKTRTKKLSEDAEDRREQLCVKIRTLSVASKHLGTARGKLEEANKLLSRENGHGRFKNLEQKLQRRQQYMIMQVGQIYPVRPLDEQSPNDKRGLVSNIIKTSDPESVLLNGSQNRPLSILGLQLSKLSVKKTGYFSDKTEFQKSATVLGYAAHAVSLIASYLNVPLRYPLRFGGSRSYVLDHAPSVEPSSMTSVVASVPPSTNMRTVEFPLFFDSQETTRSAYAIFLLNKDIEQLLNYIGAESLGPRHVLANLKQLTMIIKSQQFISVD